MVCPRGNALLLPATTLGGTQVIPSDKIGKLNIKFFLPCQCSSTTFPVFIAFRSHEWQHSPEVINTQVGPRLFGFKPCLHQFTACGFGQRADLPSEIIIALTSQG